MKKLAFIFIISTLIIVSTVLAVQAETIYYVKSGDTLWNISRKFNVSINNLYEKNNVTADRLYIGQKLIISSNSDDGSGTKTIYRVKTGDTLWKIAGKFNTTLEEIMAANNLTGYNIYPGQQLVISNNDQNENPGYIYYTVQPGDILWNIAQKYDTTVSRLVKLNNIKDAYDLYPGRKLIVNADPDNNREQEDNYSPPASNPVNPYYFYEIKEGDKIWEIADYFGLRVSTILNYNNISDNGEINSGEILVIPLRGSDKFSYLKRSSAVLNNTYRVQAGETIAEIAEYFGLSAEGLRAINRISANDNVYRGQRLQMPVNPALFTSHELYRVKSGGEYLFDIAYNKGVSIRSILKANYLNDPNLKFEEGTVILISLTEDSKATWIDYEDGKPVNSLFS